MSVLSILLVSVALLISAYRYYGRFITSRLGIDNCNITPAHTNKDGIDFVPSNRFIVLGHHFASIAGAGPIVGPVIAIYFGWVPALIWILVGGIFFGAVHDITAMTASLRHDGKSIGEIIQSHIGLRGKRLFLIFALATLMLVIAVFLDIVSRTFVSVPEAATSSLLFILLALLFGFAIKRSPLPFWLITTTGIILMYLMVWLGSKFPVEISYNGWLYILVVYIFLAAVTPVPILLQPRDFLNSFLLYGMIFLGFAGVLISNPVIEMDYTVHFYVDSLGFLFPVLFVTVACGAISGFHSLVASGTTSKQIDREEDVKLIGFGGMLIETFLAVLAVMSVAIISRGDFIRRLDEVGPVTLFSEGLGRFISSIGIPPELAISFVALAVSAFALTTLDTCTRLARFFIQEYTEDLSAYSIRPLFQNRYSATIIVVILSSSLLLSGQFAQLWPIFGSANQLLAALALLAVTVWLSNNSKYPLFTFLPMIFMFLATLTSLLLFARNQYLLDNLFLSLFSLVLFLLAVVLVYMARNRLKKIKSEQTKE